MCNRVWSPGGAIRGPRLRDAPFPRAKQVPADQGAQTCSQNLRVPVCPTAACDAWPWFHEYALFEADGRGVNPADGDAGWAAGDEQGGLGRGG